jgi:hypothetical protein
MASGFLFKHNLSEPTKRIGDVFGSRANRFWQIRAPALESTRETDFGGRRVGDLLSAFFGTID